MHVKSANFIKSSSRPEDLPAPEFPEYAFVGRSNVGKSSLINMLTGRKNLAKTSATPGKTRIINHFLINDSWYLVDLPGYGYARVSKTERKGWLPLLQQYILQRSNLLCLFVLLDARHPPQPIDMSFLEFLGHNQIPFVLVFTKTDKISGQQARQKLIEYKKELLRVWETIPPLFLTSAVNFSGKKEILDFIEETNREVKAR